MRRDYIKKKALALIIAALILTGVSPVSRAVEEIPSPTETSAPISEDTGEGSEEAGTEESGDVETPSENGGGESEDSSVDTQPNDDGDDVPSAESDPTDIPTSAIPATDLDIGDIGTVTVGGSLVLAVTVIPLNSTDTVTYTSLTPEIATVNALGRVKGLNVGTATITMEAGSVKKSVDISVVSEIVVSSIEVDGFNKKMKVDTTQTLSTSVFPTDAKNQKITYTSSNPSVASVAENGTITAKSSGKAVIRLSAGRAVKELELTVFVATEAISIPEKYMVLHPEDTYQIYASVEPQNADQKLSYSSTNEDIASVSEDGQITALSVGKTSIIIKNEDAMSVITVIVNARATSSVEGGDGDFEKNNSVVSEESLAQRIRNSGNNGALSLSGSECPMITSDVLLALYETKATLTVTYENKYQMTILGESIKNINNELPTDISVRESEDGIWLEVSKNRNMPGPIELQLLGIGNDYKYVYLFDKTYKRVNMENHTVNVGISGNYLITKEKIRENKWLIPSSAVGGVTLLAGTGVYIGVKKKYWFW